MVGISIDSYCF